MKMVMITYNEAVEMEVMEALGACGIKNYTKIMGAFGSGASSGIHMGNDIWPGRNNILYVACKDEEVKRILSGIRELRKTCKREGVKAFLLPIDELT